VEEKGHRVYNYSEEDEDRPPSTFIWELKRKARGHSGRRSFTWQSKLYWRGKEDPDNDPHGGDWESRFCPKEEVRERRRAAGAALKTGEVSTRCL